jgi:hypothetical protein
MLVYGSLVLHLKLVESGFLNGQLHFNCITLFADVYYSGPGVLLLAGLLSLKLLQLNFQLADLMNFVCRLERHWLAPLLPLICDVFENHLSELVHFLQFAFFLVQYTCKDHTVFVRNLNGSFGGGFGK